MKLHAVEVIFLYRCGKRFAVITLCDGPRIDWHCVTVNKVKVRAVFNPLKQAVACLRVDVPSVCPPAASTSSFMLPRAGLEGAPAGSHGKRRDMVTTDVRGGPHQRATGRRRAGHTSVPTHLNVAAQAAERDGPNSPRVARAMGLALADIEAECQRKAGA